MPEEATKPRVLASQKLADWLDREDKTQSWLARVLDVSPQAVSQWCSGVKRPEAVLREAVEEITGIPAPLWLTQEESESLQAALARRDESTDASKETAR